MDSRIMDDAQVAELLRVSVRTITRRLKKGPSKPGEIDIRKCRPSVIGGHRLWIRAEVEKVIGLTK